MSEVRSALASRLLELQRQIDPGAEFATQFCDRKSRRFFGHTMQFVADALAWEFGEAVELEDVVITPIDGWSDRLAERLEQCYRAGARVDLSIASYPCAVLLQQDLAARLIHLALLGIPLPGLNADLKSSALGYLFAEIIVRYEVLQRVPLMVRSVGLLSSNRKLLQLGKQLTKYKFTLELKIGIRVGGCSYSLSFLASTALLQWLQPIVRTTNLSNPQTLRARC